MSAWGGRREGAGRPLGAISKTTAEIKALAQQHGPAIITRLAELSGVIPGNAAESQTVQVQAMKELLDRGYGRAATILAGDTEGALLIDFRWADAPDSTNMSPVIEAQAADAEVDADPVATWGSSC